jgi:hypothetical protein
MTKRFFRVTLPLACLSFLAAFAAPAAEDYLTLVPDSAWGVVVVNQPADLDLKLQALGRDLQMPIPSALMMIKMQSGIQDGVDEKGSVVVVMLPPAAEGGKVVPVVLVPVTDYAKFIAPLKPVDAAAAVTEIRLMNQPYCVRLIGGYAAIVDPKSRDLIEKTLAISKDVPATLKPWREWLAARDVAGIILLPGIKKSSAKMQEGLNSMKAVMGQAGGPNQQAAAVFDMYAKLLQAADKEVAACGFGLQIDKQNAMYLTSRTELLPGSPWAATLAQLPAPKESLLKGLPGGGFVMAGGGMVSDGMMENAMKLAFDMMKTMPETYGLTGEQIDKLSKLSTDPFKGIRSVSMVMGDTAANAPLYSNVVGIMQVDNASRFVAAYEAYFQDYNQIVKDAKSQMLPPLTIEKMDEKGLPGLKITMKMPPPPNGMELPQFEKMQEAMFGPGGQVNFWLVPADEHTIFIGYVSQEPMRRAMQAAKQGTPGLATVAGVLQTAALLPPDAQMAGYVSIPGCFNLFSRIMAIALPPEMQGQMTIPEFPQTPPLGFALKAAPGELQTSLVVPGEIFKAIGEYTKAIQKKKHEAIVTPPMEE